MPPKPKEDKTVIKQFKSGESSWWVNYAHYHLNEAEELIWCSGEVDKEELRTSIIAEFKNKILQLEKYECATNSGGQDCWATMELDKEGEYVKIEDILNLF